MMAKLCVALLLFAFVSPSLGLRFGTTSTRTCGNVLKCLPILTRVPIPKIMESMKVYKNGLIMAANLTDETVKEQAAIMVETCGLWTQFSTCMGPNWFECFDIHKVVDLVNAMPKPEKKPENKVGLTRENWQVDSREVVWVRGADGKFTDESLDENFDANTVISALKMINGVCEVSGELAKEAVCFRNAYFSNEVLNNITTRQNALRRSHCLKLVRDCKEMTYQLTVYGHHLFTQCPDSIPTLTLLMKMMFAGKTNYTEDCYEIEDIMTKEHLMKTPTELDYRFGADFNDGVCRVSNISYYFDKYYEVETTPFLPMIMQSFNWPRNNLYQWDGFHPEVLWTTTTTKPTTEKENELPAAAPSNTVGNDIDYGDNSRVGVTTVAAVLGIGALWM